MSKEAMKEARSVIGTINTGKLHTLTIGGETVYWQREEWVRWALDEVLPQLDKAIANAEKQEQGEPVAEYIGNNPDELDLSKRIGLIHRLKFIPLRSKLYTTPQQRTWVGLTELEMAEFVKTMERGNFLVAIYDIEKKIKEKNT